MGREKNKAPCGAQEPACRLSALWNITIQTVTKLGDSEAREAVPLAQGLIPKGGSLTWVPIMPPHLSRITLRASLREQCEEEEEKLPPPISLHHPLPSHPSPHSPGTESLTG